MTASRRAGRLFLLMLPVIGGMERAVAAPGDFDLSFGNAGSAGVNVVPNATPGIGGDSAYAMVVQPDDKIVAAGGSYDGHIGKFALIRHTKDGPLDTSFGGDGKVTTVFGTASASANSVVLQPDGKIIAAGAAGGDFAVARYLTDGSLDTTFSGDGMTTTSLSSADDAARAVALQADGKIVVAGYAALDAEYFAVVRYLANGNPDTSFGSGGKVMLRIGGQRSKGEALAIQPDGKILVCGGIQNNANFGVLRLNANGTLDASFGTSGTVSTSFAAFTDYATAIALQVDGKIVVGGYTQTALFSGRYHFAICRYNMNGSLDTSFGSNGIKTVPVGQYGEEIRSLIIRPDGRILAVGMAMFMDSVNTYHKKTGMARFLADGSLDTTFGSGGTTISGSAGTDEESFGSALQSDGRIVMAGYYTDPNGGVDFMVGRFDSQGGMAVFGGPGRYRVFTPIAGGADTPVGVAVAADGKIYVGGTTHAGVGGWNSPRGQDFAVVRLTAGGVPDASFSGDGRQTTSIASGDSTDKAAAMVLQPDGRLIVAGSASTGTTVSGAMVRYSSNGNLDTTFGGSGKVTVPGFGITALGLQADGKIITAGLVSVVLPNAAATDVRITRHLANGSLDPTFDGDGAVQISFLDYTAENIHDIAVQPDGKIVLVGDNTFSLAIVRLNPNGSLDTSFDGDGKMTTWFSTEYSSARAVALQPDGRIVVAGNSASANGYFLLGLARFMPDGRADATFGTDGRVSTTISSAGNGWHDLVIQPDGKLVLGGWVTESDTNRFVVARYRPDGSPDTGFHGAGWMTAGLGSGASDVFGVALQSNGAIVTAGIGMGEYDYDFTVARVEAGPEISVEQSPGEVIPSGGSFGFGVVTAEAHKSVNFVVRNLGSSVLNLSNPEFVGGNHTGFDFSRPSSSVLAPGASAVFTLTFGPKGTGGRSATIRLSSNDEDEGNYDIALTGTSNLMPVFSDYRASTAFQSATTLATAKLLARASDPENDTISLTGVDPTSESGGSLQLQAGGIIYSPPVGFSGLDSFHLQITDSRGAIAAGTVFVTVASDASNGGLTSNPPLVTILPGGAIGLKFQGIPGRTYQIQRSTDLQSWTTIQTAIANPIGAIEYHDEDPPQPSGFYRLAAP